MIIKEMILQNPRDSEFAASFNKKLGELKILNSIIKTLDHDLISLINVKYVIVDRVLYISGSQLIWNYISYFHSGYKSISDREKYLDYYLIPDEYIKIWEFPEIIPELTIRGVFGRKYTYHNVFDIKKWGRWVKAKENIQFDYCLSSFRLQES